MTCASIFRFIFQKKFFLSKCLVNSYFFLIFALSNKQISIMKENYKMLLGEPCRLYHFNNITKTYEFMGLGYYIGNGYCVKDCFTDVRDDLSKGIKPFFLHYDRYIPTRLWNSDYQYAKERGELYKQQWNLKEILLPNFSVEDFNTNVIIDYPNDCLNEFWWWHEIQNILMRDILQK